MTAAKTHFTSAAGRIAADAGVLFGAVQVAYNAPQSPLYAWLTGVSLAAGIGIKAFNLFPRFPMPMLLSGVSLAVIAAHSAIGDGMAAVHIWTPAAAFALANVARVTEAGAKKIWNKLSTAGQRVVNGENFAAVGVGLIAFFTAGPDNIGTTVLTSLCVLAALAFGTKGHNDVSRLVLGGNALVAMGAALGNDYLTGALANLLSAGASLSLWYEIRRERGLSVPYGKLRP